MKAVYTSLKGYDVLLLYSIYVNKFYVYFMLCTIIEITMVGKYR